MLELLNVLQGPGAEGFQQFHYQGSNSESIDDEKDCSKVNVSFKMFGAIMADEAQTRPHLQDGCRRAVYIKTLAWLFARYR